MKNRLLKHSIRVLVIGGALALMLTQTPQAARAQTCMDIECANDICGNPDCVFVAPCGGGLLCRIIGNVCEVEYNPCED